MPYLTVNLTNLDYRLRRSRRVKRLQILFHYGGFEVIAPPRLSNHIILSFIWEKRYWMERTYRHHHHQPQPRVPSPPKYFYSGNMLLYRGKEWALQWILGESFEVVLVESMMIITLPSTDERELHPYLVEWLQGQARVLIQSVVDRVCPQLDRWPGKVVLKQQKTRWGSCGINENIQINWRLIFAPEGVLEYVVVHELCHLIHRNHGKRFWKRVAQCFPGFEPHRAWLRKKGGELMNIYVMRPAFSLEESFRSSVESL